MLDVVRERSSVLVVDDERRYRDLLQLNFVRGGYRVLLAADGLTTLNLLECEHVDLVMLDVGLPDLDGYELCRRIREESNVPIIMLTARADQESKVRGLRIGADDYVTKPFGADELLARVAAVLRRGNAQAPSRQRILINGELTIDFTQHRVLMRGRELSLTRQEYRLLCCLAENVGRVLVQEELLRRVWGVGYEGESELLHTTVRRLRTKIEDNPSAPCYVVTRRSVGYLMAQMSN